MSSRPTVSDLLRPLVDVTDRGLYDCTTAPDDSSREDDGEPSRFRNWADHIAAGARSWPRRSARLDPAKPPHRSCC